MLNRRQINRGFCYEKFYRGNSPCGESDGWTRCVIYPTGSVVGLPVKDEKHRRIFLDMFRRVYRSGQQQRIAEVSDLITQLQMTDSFEDEKVEQS